MKNRIKKIKKTIGEIPAKPDERAFLPILLVTVCMAVAFIAMIIDRFIFSFGNDLLSPIMAQLVAMLIPAYLCMLLLCPEKKLSAQIKRVGMARIGHEYVFFLIFSALFVITTALLLNIIFGGVYASAKGFTLLGTFTAGENEYTVNVLYLVVVYAVIPAVIEELVFRGIVYSELCGISEGLAACISSLLSAFFAFTLGGLPAALFCALAYCFVRFTTGSLLSCIIVHLAYNLYALFLATNVSKYFISAQNTALLTVIIIGAWLISTALFVSESARVYRMKAEKIKDGEIPSKVPRIKLRELLIEAKSAFIFPPTLVCAIITLALYVATMVIGILA